MEKATIETGMKLMLMEKYRDDITGITVDEVIKENKTTFSTKKKQILTSRYFSEMHFHLNYSGDRKKVVCDVTGKEFNPDRVRVFNQKEYNSIKHQIKDDIAAIAAKKAASELHKERRAKAVKEYIDLREKMEAEAFPILKDSFIKNMCVSCKNYQVDGTCKNDSDFYNAGVLKESENHFFDSMTTMCNWESKES